VSQFIQGLTGIAWLSSCQVTNQKNTEYLQHQKEFETGY
jgi:hypothetical protein